MKTYVLMFVILLLLGIAYQGSSQQVIQPKPPSEETMAGPAPGSDAKRLTMEEGKTIFGLGYSLEYICSFTATLRPEVIGPLAEGLRVNYHFTGGEVDGPKLRGKFRPGGADFVTMRRDGVGVLDIRGTIETHDGAVIYVIGSGLTYTSEDAYERAMKKDLPASVPLRAALHLATVHPGYLWVNRLQFVEIGEMVRARGEVHVDLYALK
jgi:hypothetical protein